MGSVGVGWLDDVIVIFWIGNREKGQIWKKKMRSKCLVYIVGVCETEGRNAQEAFG